MIATRKARRSAAAKPEIDLVTPRPVRRLVKDSDREFQEQWFIALDPSATETLDERVSRYLSDERIVHMGGIAAISGRRYSFIKRLNSDARAWRRTLRSLSPIDERAYDQLVEERILAEERGDQGAVETIAAELRQLDRLRNESPHAALLDINRTNLLLALPEPLDDGASPLWYANEIFRLARRKEWLDAWYEPEKKDPPGRKPGSRNRAKPAELVTAG